MKDESHAEALGESARLLDKDESVAMCSLPSVGISRQYAESGPSTRTQNGPIQEERIEVGFDRMCCTWFQRCFPRMFEVVGRGDPEALSNLLTSCTTEVHSMNSEGDTALHHAVASACRKDDYPVDSFYQCIDLLMSCEQMHVNRPNKEGYTAIGLAVQHFHRTCVERMLEHPSADRLYLDYYPGDSESTVREIIMETYPGLQTLLPEPLMERLDSSHRNIKLLAALQRGKFEDFCKYLNGTNVNLWYNEPYHSYLLEIACQMKNREEFVRLLLDSGAYPNITNRVTGMPLLHTTARSGNFEVLQLLLEKGGINTSLKDKEKRTILHWLAGVSEGKSDDKEKIEKCLKLLLESYCIRKKGVDDRDSFGNTSLFIAVERGFRDRAKLLLSKGADVRVFENGSTMLLSDSLSILKEFLDDCLQDNGRPLSSRNLRLTLNCQSIVKIVPLILKSKLHRVILTHPVMSTFLSLKWQKVRLLFALDMAFYVMFLCSLTEYILSSEPHNRVNDGCAASNNKNPFSFNNSNITFSINDQRNSSQDIRKGILAILLFFLLLRELLHLFVYRSVYLHPLEYTLELLLSFATAICISVEEEYRELWFHSSAVALFLGWFELLLMSGRMPLLSEQIEMFIRVSETFLRFMAGYVTLLIAFAFSFYILFRRSSEKGGAGMFADLPSSLFKTFVMFTGDFDVSNLCFDTFPYTSHVLFSFFLLLVAIILLNLLNGLAVNDTGELRKNAETLSIVARAKLIYGVERFVIPLRKLSCNYVDRKETTFEIYPNWRNRIGSDNFRSLLNIITKRRESNEKAKLTGINEDWRLFKEKFSDLQFRLDELEKKLDLKFDETLQILKQILTNRHKV
jgi:ankyrin repeat protein